MPERWSVFLLCLRSSLCWGAFCTPEAHLYCFKLNIKLVWGFFWYFFKKQDMLSASFCAGDLAGGGGTERGLDPLVVLIVRA